MSDGVEEAKELGLPRAVINIIAEHHGNSVKAYFMRKEMELNEQRPENERKTKEEIESEYRYKEPRASSKESAVVHLADSVEAASVSNKDRLQTSDDREKLIENIINAKIADHQLDDSGITYGDVELIKAAFLKELNDKNYTRITYQTDSNGSEENKTVKPEQKTETEETKQDLKSALEKKSRTKKTDETDGETKTKKTVRKTSQVKKSEKTEE